MDLPSTNDSIIVEGLEFINSMLLKFNNNISFMKRILTSCIEDENFQNLKNINEYSFHFLKGF